MFGRNRHLLLTVGALLLAIVITGCTGKQGQAPSSTPQNPQQGPPKAQKLSVAIQEEPRSFNTLYDPGAEGHMVEGQIYEGLVGLDTNGDVKPMLASEYQQTQPNVFVFTLRKGVKFHDGTPLTADDVVYNYVRILDKNTGSVQWKMYDEYISKVEKLSDDKVQITLKKAWPDFLTVLAAKPYTYIAGKTAIEKAGKDYGVNIAVGTGPFKLDEWKKGEYVRLVKNPDYWDPNYPKLDQITFKIIPESGSQLIALKSGDVDMLFDAPYKDIVTMSKDPEFKVDRHGSGAAQEVWLNTAKKPFSDKKVRQALDLAINKQEIVDAVFYGFGKVSDSIFPEWHWAANKQLKFQYDPEKAKSLLKEAGYDEKNPLKFEMLTVPVPQYHDQAVLIQAHLKKIGVEVKIVDLEKAAMVKKRDAGEFEAIMYRLIWDAPTLDYTWRPYGAESYLNQARYNMPGGFQNPEAEKALQAALVEYDREKARALFATFDKMIADDVPKAKLLFADNINIMHNYVKGYNTWVMDIVPMKGIYIEK